MVVRPFSVATFTHFSPLTRTLYLKRSNYFSFVVFLLNLSEVMLVNEITQVLSSRFRNASYVCCAVCSPPRVKASVTQEPQAGSLHPGCSGKPSGEHGGLWHAAYCSRAGTLRQLLVGAAVKGPGPRQESLMPTSKTRVGFAHGGAAAPSDGWQGAARLGPGADSRVRPARCLPWPLAGSPRSPEHAEGLSSASTPHLLSRSA